MAKTAWIENCTATRKLHNTKTVWHENCKTRRLYDLKTVRLENSTTRKQYDTKTVRLENCMTKSPVIQITETRISQMFISLFISFNILYFELFLSQPNSLVPITDQEGLLAHVACITAIECKAFLSRVIYPSSTNYFMSRSAIDSVSYTHLTLPTTPYV